MEFLLTNIGQLMNYTDEEKQQGYSVCKECNNGVRLLQAGFEVDTHVCAMCKTDVADADEFFKPADVEMMSK